MARAPLVRCTIFIKEPILSRAVFSGAPGALLSKKGEAGLCDVDGACRRPKPRVIH